MQKHIGLKIFAILVASVLATLCFLPSLPQRFVSESARHFLPATHVNLGLDLQGGMHLVLRVEREIAVTNMVGRSVDGLVQLIKAEGPAGATASRDGGLGVVIDYDGTPQTRDKLEKLMKDRMASFEPAAGATAKQLRYALSASEATRIRDSAVSQTLETIRNRIDQFGVSEPLIQRQGDDEVLVQLPGVSNPDRAIELIGKTALLEFKPVDEKVPYTQGMTLPEDDEVLYERVLDKKTGQELERIPYVLKKQAVLTGDMLTDARNAFDQFNDAYVAISFNSMGATIFEEYTGQHVGERFAIVLDNTVYSAPVIQERIGGGSASISGRFTTEQATDLAIVLRAGSLAAPVSIIQNVTVGPSLGADSIRAGMTATLAGLVMVVLFMTVYYKLSGLIANMAMMLNLVLLMGALSMLGATLTLPGIAGILLTIGMGVDSNVLIFERIRDELRLGKGIRIAIDQGFDLAFLTILDAHVTTLITAVVLFLFGSGPIKGFAVTLSLGILINLFTAFVGTKVVFDWMTLKRRMTRLSI